MGKSLILRKKVIKILILYLFQNIFNDFPFFSTFFLFLDTPWNNILFYCCDVIKYNFKVVKQTAPCSLEIYR